MEFVSDREHHMDRGSGHSAYHGQTGRNPLKLEMLMGLRPTSAYGEAFPHILPRSASHARCRQIAWRFESAGDLAKSVVVTSKIEPITKVEIKSKASGIVKKLYVCATEMTTRGVASL
jgi:hypothetical protein